MNTIYVAGDINEEMVGEVLLAIEHRVSRIILNSTGGCICDAMAIYDALIGRDIIIVATGSCMSAALIVLLAGSRRFATEHTRFMLHPVLTEGADYPTDAETNEANLLTCTVADILHTRGCIPVLKARALISESTYFGSSHAKALGIIHDLWHGEAVPIPGLQLNTERNN
jgi:ATP-dependent protease ClpP protease subunit